jgi:Reverse transcriptase (RNA-dependent DNA polymerase).
MASYDITNLYTNIPIKETIKIIKTKLNTNTEEHTYTEQLTKAIETILNQNYFRFNNKIYKQEDGIPMGSPTSSILSEIFIQNLEEKHFDRIIKNHNIKLLAR